MTQPSYEYNPFNRNDLNAWHFAINHCNCSKSTAEWDASNGRIDDQCEDGLNLFLNLHPKVSYVNLTGNPISQEAVERLKKIHTKVTFVFTHTSSTTNC